ncbi:MAG TPA: hypothetical protein VH682_13125 [Gemmataceae bacterium]
MREHGRYVRRGNDDPFTLIARDYLAASNAAHSQVARDRLIRRYPGCTGPRDQAVRCQTLTVAAARTLSCRSGCLPSAFEHLLSQQRGTKDRNKPRFDTHAMLLLDESRQFLRGCFAQLLQSLADQIDLAELHRLPLDT